MYSILPKILLGSVLFVGTLGAPTPPAVAALQTQAHGTLPGGHITLTDGSVGEDGIISVQLLNFNENFEVAFFTSLINNVTQSVPGFTPQGEENGQPGFVEILKTILAVSRLRNVKLPLTPASKKPSTPPAFRAFSKARISLLSNPVNTPSRLLL
jgi:hypothetical protein